MLIDTQNFEKQVKTWYLVRGCPTYIYKNPTVLTYTYRSHQPRLGISSNNNNNNNTYLFDEDPGIMSEVETSSTRFRKPSRGENHRPPPAASSGAATLYATKQPRTSIKNNSHSSSHSSGGNNSSYSLYYEADDPGIMSEAETASTTRGKRSSSRNNSIPSNYKSSQRYILHTWFFFVDFVKLLVTNYVL